MQKVLLSAILFTFLTFPQQAQTKKYEANWKSLDSRPNPEWYRDAKFGIFIHWGLYSVPAWAKKGTYSEWYWNTMQDKSDSTWLFHKNTYGEKFKYQDFVSMFKAELYEPDDWAEVFVQSGAKYIVPTSKHHDGFCLWPSAQAWNWNSVDVGPHRDLLGDLVKAVRKKDLRIGFYYSLYEWYNPVYNSNINDYVDNHFIPQFQDVVTRYKPDIIFADGEWDYTSKVWKTPQLLAWLFNDSPVGKNVVINDRWGSECRGVHGGYFTTEYGDVNANMSEQFMKRGWEENRGIGFSFGYNRHEDISDYQTAESLVHMLVEIVSKGGNFLLDIGPTADGRIPVIMQERLLQMGKWLQVNGEAIYSSRPYQVDHEGKTIRFTKSKDGKYVYAVSSVWPGNYFKLSDVKPIAGSQVYMLGVKEPLKWEWKNNSLNIQIPQSIQNNKPCDYSYSFKIEAMPYVEKPEVLIEGNSTEDNQSVSIDKKPEVKFEEKTPGAKIYYTIDGSEPDKNSKLYTGSFVQNSPATLKARAFKNNMAPSIIVSSYVDIADSKINGINYSYYEGQFLKLPDFKSIKPKNSGKVFTFSIDKVKKRADHYAILFQSEIKIPESGKYTFYLKSDDGSKLIIDGKEVINNDGSHSSTLKKGKINLSKGMHSIEVQYFEDYGDEALQIDFEGPGIERMKIPASLLYTGSSK